MSDSQARPRIKLGRSVDTPAPLEQGPPQAPFPGERTIRWVPRAASSLPAPDVDLIVDQRVLLQVNAHVSESIEKEIGGFLLGNRYQSKETGREFVIIDQYSPAEFTEETAVSLSFTLDAWAKLEEDLDGKFSGKLLVGWYHSHPRMDIFLSAHDVPIHEQRFPEAWKSALVITPDKHLGGFFCRRAGALNPRVSCEFFEYLEGAEIRTRESVMDWEGYDAFDSEGKKIPVARSPKKAESRPQPRTRFVPAVPEKVQPFPAERVIHWLPNAAAAQPLSSALLVTQGAFDAISHNLRLGGAGPGFLLGNAYRCPNSRQRYLVIDQLSSAVLAGPGASSVFTPDSISRLREELGGKYLGKEVIGWYQPFTSDDVFRAEPVFPELADEFPAVIMTDATHGRGCVLRSRNGEPCDFFELREVGAAGSVVNWSNYRVENGGGAAPGGKAAAVFALRAAPVGGKVSPLAELTKGNRPIYAGAALLVLFAGAYAMFRPGPKPAVPTPATAGDVKKAAAAPSSEIDIAVIPERVDPNNPNKGLRLTLNLQPAPEGDFDLRIRNRPASYQLSKDTHVSDGSLTLETTLTDELVKNAGEIPLKIQVLKKDSDQELGQNPYVLKIGELGSAKPADAKKNFETAHQAAKEQKAVAKAEPPKPEPAVTPPAQPYQDPGLLARLKQLEEDQKKHTADQEAEINRLRFQLDQASKKAAREPAQPPAPAPKPVPQTAALVTPPPSASVAPAPPVPTPKPAQIDYSSLAARTDALATDLTSCLKQRVKNDALHSFTKVPDFPACARIVLQQQSLLQELLRLPSPPGPFTQLGTLVAKLTNNSWTNKDLPVLRDQLWGVRDKLKALR